jgi:glutamate--cysteine ligase catalytic subunit
MCNRYIAYIKEHGIIQFLNIYARLKDRTNDLFLWGDEIEGQLLYFPSHAPTVKVILGAYDVIEAVERLQSVLDESERNAFFLPEYGRHMVEATPRRPYGSFTSDLSQVEVNMRKRRELIERVLVDEEKYLTLTIFPLLGVGNFTQRPFSVYACGFMCSVMGIGCGWVDTIGKQRK